MIDEVLTDFVLRVRSGLAVAADQIPRIIEDPRSYEREALLLAILVVLLLVFLVLMAFAVWEAILDERERRRLGVRVKRLGKWRPPAVAAIVVAVALVVLSVVPMVPAAGAACGNCHAVESAVERWESGPHRTTACYGCHSAPGPLGAMAASAGGLVRLANASSREGRVYEDTCLECHHTLTEGLAGETVLMRHSDVIEAAMPCLECHPQVGHTPDPETVGSFEQIARHRMSLCLTCHNNVIASSECDTCHLGKPLDVAIALSESYQTPIAPGCKGCHTPQTSQACVDCHGLELPHPRPEFHRAHAGISYRQPDLCTRCHELAVGSRDQACGCHRHEDNIHGTYSQWFPQHGPAARQNGPGACMCHDTGRFCGMCHDSNPY